MLRCSTRLSLALGLLFLAACTSGPAPGGPSAAQPGARAPKTLTIAVQREPATFEGYTERGTESGAGIAMDIAHNRLVVRNDKGTYVPQLAVEQISVEKGTWRVNPDGTMETTWRIHPNVKWHDGSPFTSADLLFAFTLSQDPELPVPNATELRQMESASTPDPSTLVVRWGKTYVRANQAPGLIPRPRHLLEDLYRSDKAAFVNSPLFSTEFVGLGPYRMARWERGSHIEFTPFADYFLGSPPLDSVVVRYIGDPNTMVANILSGAVDVILPPSADIDAALEVQRRWEGTGNQVRFNITDDVRRLQLQFVPEFARPNNAITNRSVRQALYHGIDRQSLADVLTNGQAPLADSWIPPNHELRPQVEASIPKYPHDLARAQQLLAQAGWVRGADGTLAHSQSGERFETELWTTVGTGTEKEAHILADGLKAVGIRLNVYVLPAALAQDREQQSKFPFASLTDPRWDSLYDQLLDSRSIPTAENRWSGRNRGGYANPNYDAIVDRLRVTIELRDQAALHRQLLEVGMGDVATIPLYWVVDPVFVLKGTRGPIEAVRGGWNFFAWDKL